MNEGVMADIVRQVNDFNSVQYGIDEKALDFIVGNMDYKDIKAMPMSEFMKFARAAVKEKERRYAPKRDSVCGKLKENIFRATPVRIRRMW